MNAEMMSMIGDKTQTMNRRRLLRVMAGGAAVAAGALALGGSASADWTGYFLTTAALNMRSRPDRTSSILLVVPNGAGVAQVAGVQNGYRKVSYRGTVGWVLDAYLRVTNGGSSDSPPPMVASGYTTTAVNLRSGPSTSHSVLRVLAKGTTIQVSDMFVSGFRYVSHNGLAGWVYADYIANGNGPVSGYVTTTTDLNLRAEPSTSARVLTVMPKGAQVRPSDQLANGFRQVTYGTLTGWAWDAYLA
jgi:uncharacterized protein YraI